MMIRKQAITQEMKMAANLAPAPQPVPMQGSIIEQRVRLMIGDLMVNNAALMVQLEECQREIAERDKQVTELKEKLPAEKPAKAA
jgi:hypothetical protein